MKKKECYICKHDTEFLFKKFDYNLLKCKKCSLIFLWPQPTKKELEKIYSSNTGYHVDFSKEFLINQKKRFFDRINYAKDIIKKCNLSIFDIGTANGLFLDVAKENNCYTYGIEINPVTAEKCKEYGHDVIAGSVDTHTFIKVYDVVHMGDVLEHMLDPRTTIKKISNALEPNGVAIIAVPNASGLFQKITLYIAKYTGLDWPHALPPAHSLLII